LTLDNLLDKLNDVRQSGDGHIACCPAHADSTPSLSIHQSEDGRILLHCFAGCDFTAICDALQITPSDLRPDSGRGPGATPPRPQAPKPRPPQGPGFDTAEAALAACRVPSGYRRVALYEYNRDGQPFGCVARYENDRDKTFRQVHYRDGRWYPGGPDSAWPLFHPDPSQDGPVFVCEGEFACLAAVGLGLDAVTSAGGSNAPAKSDWSPLAGRDVVILPDNDAPGLKYAQTVRDILTRFSPPASVSIIELDGLPPSGDIVQWLEARRSAGAADENLLTELLEHAVKSATPAFFYDRDRRDFLLQNSRGIWLRLAESPFKKELAVRGYSSTKSASEPVSPADAEMIRIRDRYDVAFAGALAGHKSGFYEMSGDRILVTTSPTIIPAHPGEWQTLNAMLNGMLDHTAEQLPFLYGWLKIAYESLAQGSFRPGQALALCGPRNCGKSLFQTLLTAILGGRVGKPYSWLVGNTDFNGDLFEAEHLEVADEPGASTDIRSRRNFGAMLKQICSTDSHRCHAKYRQAITLKPFWRISISVNDEPENLLVMPPIDESLEDKIIMLKCVSKPMPMPTATTADRTSFMRRLTGELPAFLHHLSQWVIPAELSSERFGIGHYQHPDLLRELAALSPEFRLLQMIDRALFIEISDLVKAHDQWQGTAEDLEILLTNDTTLGYEARRLFSWNNACATYLGRLSTQAPERVQKHRTNTSRRWIITAPPPDPDSG